MSTAVNDGSLEAIVLKALALNCKKNFFTFTSKGTALCHYNVCWKTWKSIHISLWVLFGTSSAHL